MANIKSAKKRVLVAQTKRMRNRSVKSGLKTALKKYDGLSTTEELGAALPETVSAVDKAAAKGVISKNAANRKKAQLAKKAAEQN
ncbi:MAG: 30S ribosomal protein S20 [Eubacteriales bacterium]|nr:30S ribosomal protein S20 [Eubacteriales bacterium]